MKIKLDDKHYLNTTRIAIISPALCNPKTENPMRNV